MRSRATITKPLVAGLGALATLGALGAVSGCGDGEERARQEAAVAELEHQLENITAERDALQDHVDAVLLRYVLVVKHDAEQEALLADDSLRADPDALLDELSYYVIDGARLHNETLGSTSWRFGMRGTLFTTAEATIDNVHSWIDPDGSTTGSLFVWSGTNAEDEPFALAGVAIQFYNDDGLLTHTWVAHPYPDGFIWNAVQGSGTPTDIEGTPWEATDSE
ncbi:hypothetical protein [Demequina pelophila]|uniref:hypothetical protein n=1 Tax=Demequina pelophila TaxID=1638984 RepID=UPI000782358D|nr:hypothetical protein [Demequina pelophila]